MSDKPDVYQRVTDKIIADLERGQTRPGSSPGRPGIAAGPVSRPLRAEGKPYRGVNVLMLWASAMEKGYESPIWMTYRQAAEPRRPGAEGRERIAGRLCRPHHAARNKATTARRSNARSPS